MQFVGEDVIPDLVATIEYSQRKHLVLFVFMSTRRIYLLGPVAWDDVVHEPCQPTEVYAEEYTGQYHNDTAYTTDCKGASTTSATAIFIVGR